MKRERTLFLGTIVGYHSQKEDEFITKFKEDIILTPDSITKMSYKEDVLIILKSPHYSMTLCRFFELTKPLFLSDFGRMVRMGY